ncbi:hypothetical protein GCM10027277_56830 [Pseudoduganella ginsengisoli]
MLVAVALLFLLPKGGGVWFGGVFLFFLAWALYNVVRLLLKRGERRSRAIRLAIWSAALLLAGATQVHWQHASLDQANAVATALVSASKRNGAYPTSLDAAGFNSAALREEWGITYRLYEGKPQLSYPAVFMPLALMEYDFDAGQWKTNAH